MPRALRRQSVDEKDPYGFKHDPPPVFPDPVPLHATCADCDTMLATWGEQAVGRCDWCVKK